MVQLINHNSFAVMAELLYGSAMRTAGLTAVRKIEFTAELFTELFVIFVQILWGDLIAVDF
jgi:hypothetical protein